jgi:hypothetical protein
VWSRLEAKCEYGPHSLYPRKKIYLAIHERARAHTIVSNTLAHARTSIAALGPAFVAARFGCNVKYCSYVIGLSLRFLGA